MTPDQIATAAKKSINGVPGCNIAQSMGLHPSTISRNLNRPEIRDLIQKEAQEIINRGLKPARRTLTRLAALGNTKGADKDTLKLSLDASKHITSMAGLSGSSPSTIINQMIQINQAPEQHAELATLRGYLASRWGAQNTEAIQEQDNVQDAEVIGIEQTHTEPPEPNAVTGSDTPEDRAEVVDNSVVNLP